MSYPIESSPVKKPNLIHQSLPVLPDISADDAVLKRVRQHAPLLQFDKLEPFLPLVAGFTLFETSAPSSSFKREIVLPKNCAYAIEYAIWWDWDIQHLYELEHLWVYLDKDDQLILAEGSFHGSYHTLETNEGIPSKNNRLVAFSEAGKHAFAASPEQLKNLRPVTNICCNEQAGSGDVLIKDFYADSITANPVAQRMCKRYMKAHAFTPSYDYSQQIDLAKLPLWPWEELNAWIPQRVNTWLDRLMETPKLEAVFLDCGDTLIDEGTEQKDKNGTVTSAEQIPSAKELLIELKKQGYRVALVADGTIQSFKNIFEQHDFTPYFEVETISEAVGVDKPDARMFNTAINELALEAEKLNYEHIVMVGNNLARDIKGANLLGMTTVWLDWAPRRSKIPADASEVPDFTIKAPIELIQSLAQQELQFMQTYLNRLEHVSESL